MAEYYIIDKETGEELTTVNEGDTFRIMREKTKDYLSTTIELNKNESFIKVYSKSLFELSRSLSGTESQFVNYLIQYIRYGSGILAHDNGDKLTRVRMAKDTALSIKTIDRLMQSLIEKQVIGKHKTGHDITYTVNPFIFMKGSRVNETLFTFYRHSKWNRAGV